MKNSLLARLEHQHNALDYLLAGLTETQIRQRPSPDKWSIFENIAHLARYQEVFLKRMKDILTENQPGFDRYTADQDDGFPDWTSRSYSELFIDFRKVRDAILRFANQLAEGQLQRTGLHPVYGAMTLEGWTEFFLLHEAHHLLTILKLAGQLRSPDVAMG